MARPDWNQYFMAIAKIVSTRSTCNSRPTGAVIVRDRQILVTGYNGSMPNAPHCIDENVDGGLFCYRRHIGAPEFDKYNYCRASHAEANAIAQAARLGIPLEGATLYVTLAPCYVCLKLIATARIKHIYYEYKYQSTDPKRDAFWEEAVREAGIETFEQCRLAESTVKQLIAALEYPTSKRRLGENGQSLEQERLNGRPHRSTFRLIKKKLLLDILTNCLHQERDNQIVGKECFIDSAQLNERFSFSDKEIILNNKAMTFLLELGITEGYLIKSEVLNSLIRQLISSGQSAVASGSKWTIIAKIAASSLRVEMILTELDVYNFIDAAWDALIAVTAYMHSVLMDRFDIDINVSGVSLCIRKPFVKIEDIHHVKEWLLVT